MKIPLQKLILVLGGIATPLMLFAAIDFIYTKTTKNYLKSLGVPFISDKGKYSEMLDFNPKTGWYRPKPNLSGKTFYGPVQRSSAKAVKKYGRL